MNVEYKNVTQINQTNMPAEKFEQRLLTGEINIACKYDDGTVRYWQTRKETVVEHIKQIVAEFKKDDYVLTLRQLHYQLVSNNWIVNHDTAYKKLGTILDDCRYSGVIDWNAIEDRGRVPFLPYWAAGIKDALNDTVSNYRLDRQEGQMNCVELWTEKDALSGILSRITNKYHIRLVINKGYTSSSAAYNAYKRIIQAISDGQRFTILYFGDHDPSGLDMVRDIKERLEFMLINGDGNTNTKLLVCENWFQVIHIGLTMEQIKKYKLTANPTKSTDTRANNYVSKFGKTCWEVDALKPHVLTSIVESWIEHEIHLELYHEMVKRESQDILKMKKKFSGIRFK
jgi:hypothetical protein